jgi:hypothetical protein
MARIYFSLHKKKSNCLGSFHPLAVSSKSVHSQSPHRSMNS